jgi:hypothetical protein
MGTRPRTGFSSPIRQSLARDALQRLVGAFGIANAKGNTV